MCGLVAIISKNKRPPEETLTRKMINEIDHRGPDSQSCLTKDWYSLGFCRLSILDVSENGDQPLTDNGVHAVCNGEIYNFKEIRKELETKGHLFRSDSDSEVVLRGYQEWGESVIDKLRGMFAFIIVDDNEDKVFGARDHLGIKPLYICEDNDFYYFSSEIKSFNYCIDLAHDQDTFYEQIVYGFVSGTRTPFVNISKIEAGHLFIIQERGLRIDHKKYYDVKDKIGKYSKISHEEALYNVQEKLHESILSHTQSDVGFTIQLSGGIDSSYITAVLANELGTKLKTFAGRLDHAEFDEGVYQKQVAETCKTNHFEQFFGPEELLENIEKATYHMDVPLKNLPSIFLKLICAQSKNHSKVILTGEGADEAFSGYSRYFIDPKVRMVELARSLGVKSDMLPSLGPLKKIKRRLKNSILDYQIYWDKYEFDELLQLSSKSNRYREDSINIKGGVVEKMMAHDQTAYLENLLHRQDRMSMAEGVEARVPFCTPEIFDFANTIPLSSKLKTSTKSLVKELSLKYFDKDFVYRRKNGFRLPIDDWLKGPLSPLMTMLEDNEIKNCDLYNLKGIKAKINEFKSGNSELAKHLMQIIVFEVWRRSYLDKKKYFKK